MLSPWAMLPLLPSLNHFSSGFSFGQPAPKAKCKACGSTVRTNADIHTNVQPVLALHISTNRTFGLVFVIFMIKVSETVYSELFDFFFWTEKKDVALSSVQYCLYFTLFLFVQKTFILAAVVVKLPPPFCSPFSGLCVG